MINLNRSGIILAAGLGSRIRGDLNDSQLIKPLTSVDGLILLLRTIHSLEKADCKEIVVILGYRAEQIKKYVIANYSGNSTVRFAVNEKYHLQNGLSVLCARPHVGEEFVLTMADHILDDKIMSMIRTHKPPKGGATLCVDYKLDTIFDMDDATKVQSRGSYISRIGKELTEFNCIDTGVFVGTGGLFDAIEKVYHEKKDASLSEGVQLLADKNLMIALDIKDAFWQDVDNYEMLAHAEDLLRSAKNLKTEGFRS
jgi:choline kinase